MYETNKQKEMISINLELNIRHEPTSLLLCCFSFSSNKTLSRNNEEIRRILKLIYPSLKQNKIRNLYNSSKERQAMKNYAYTAANYFS